MTSTTASGNTASLSGAQTKGLKRSIELNQGLLDHLQALHHKLGVCRESIKRNADILQRKRKRRPICCY